MRNFKLGDVVERALATVGVTEERVTKALGRPCGCKRRREMLNRLSLWAARVVTGRAEDAEKYLEEIIGGAEQTTGVGDQTLPRPSLAAPPMESEAKSPQAPDTNGGRPTPIPTDLAHGDRGAG